MKKLIEKQVVDQIYEVVNQKTERVKDSGQDLGKAKIERGELTTNDR